jgi:molybdopterin-guanine dinucleotide biosynthesis protein MobB
LAKNEARKVNKMDAAAKAQAIKNMVQEAAEPAQVGKKTERVLSLTACGEIARTCDVSRREVELIALEGGIVPGRYLRNIGTIGKEGQLCLVRATVAVVGCGGLGGLVVELLARMGVGRLILIDNDVFSDNNLNRQILAREADLGRPKVEVARERVWAINPATEVTYFQERLTPENARALLQGADLVVDALDNLPARFALEAAARASNIPLVHGAIAGFLGQVLTIFPGDPGLAEIYGSVTGRERGIEVETGNLAATAALVASLEVQEVIKILTGVGEPLRCRLFYIDSASGQMHSLPLGQTGKTANDGAAAQRPSPTVISFVGTSGSGKTTLLMELIQGLVRRGVKVAAVKHTHEDVETDTAGKDTWRFAQAGAEAAALLTPKRATLFYELGAEAAVERLRDWFGPLDIVLLEGLKSGPFPKIAVFRRGVSEPITRMTGRLVAVFGDVAAARQSGLSPSIPGFTWRETEKLIDFIITQSF